MCIGWIDPLLSDSINLGSQSVHATLNGRAITVYATLHIKDILPLVKKSRVVIPVAGFTLLCHRCFHLNRCTLRQSGKSSDKLA